MSVDCEVEAGHFVLAAVLGNVGGFIIFTEEFGRLGHLLLSVRVKEPIRSCLNDRANKFSSALPLCVLVRHRYGVVGSSDTVRNSQGFVVLSFLHHLNFFVRVHNCSGGLLLDVTIAARFTGSKGFSFGKSLLSHGDSQPNESSLVGVGLINNSDILILTLSILSPNHASNLLSDNTFGNVSELNLVVNIINFEASLFLLDLLNHFSWHFSSDEHEESVEDKVHSFSVFVAQESRVM